MPLTDIEIRHFHLFCGLGGGARGFNRGEARVGSLNARFRCLGGLDVDPAATRDFGRLADVPGTVIDLFDRAQYMAFHGREPPADWREAMPDDIRRAAGGERPHIVFTSSPCKGFSGLLSERQSIGARYQALNALTLRGIWLMLEAWSDDPPELVVFENVPRIATRGRALLDRIGALLRHHGYAAAETMHDCGELGHLAQSRKRFLLVARHLAKVPPFLYEPGKHRLRGIGEVLDKLPLPLSGLGGPMHRMPALQWRTWVRLAFVEAGSDWRSLNRLRVGDGILADYGIAPERAWQADVLGVRRWEEPLGCIAGRSLPTNGGYSVADPRGDGWHHGPFGVNGWTEPMGAVTGQGRASTGKFAVADPRRRDGRAEFGQYGIKGWDDVGQTVIAKAAVGAGNFSVADPRPDFTRAGRAHYQSGGHYGVVPYDAPSGTVTASGQHDNGRWSVADPRTSPFLPSFAGEKEEMPPAAERRLVCVIRALDGTWHRPFTTLELAALQSLVDPEEYLELDGLSDSAWRERIGNAVPPAAAQAIASVMGRTLLLAWSGQAFMLSSEPIWVRPIALALSVQPGGTDV